MNNNVYIKNLKTGSISKIYRILEYNNAYIHFETNVFNGNKLPNMTTFILNHGDWVQVFNEENKQKEALFYPNIEDIYNKSLNYKEREIFMKGAIWMKEQIKKKNNVT